MKTYTVKMDNNKIWTVSALNKIDAMTQIAKAHFYTFGTKGIATMVMVY